jgi:hypothetical protein
MAIDRLTGDNRAELKAPDETYILDLQTELTDNFRQQDEDIDDARSVREMRVPAMAEADQRYVLVAVDPRDPDITEEAFQQTAMLTLDRPKLQIVGGEGDTAQTVASKLEHWTEETLWACGTRELGADTMTQVTDACLNDGGGWSKLLWAADLWGARYGITPPAAGDPTEAYQAYDKLTEDAKKKAGPPFVWSYVDPRTVYPQRSGGCLEEILEITEMTMRSAFRKYRLARDKAGDIVPEELGAVDIPWDSHSGEARSPLATVQWVEHWDDTWVTYMVMGRNYRGAPTGHIVKQFKHKYPFGVPYDYAPGLTMSHWRNRKVGWGIGRTKLWLVKYRQYLRAMHAQYVARDLLSPLVTYGDSPATPVGTGDGLPREQADLALHPGEILNLPPGRQLTRIEYADAATLEKHMALVDQAIKDLESPRVTTLSGMEGAGFAISQVLQYTRTRVGPVRHGLEQLLYGQTEKLWALVRERAQEKVWVFWGGGDVGNDQQAAAEFIGFGPKDLERPMHIQWQVEAQLPTDEMIRARYAHERLAAGTFGKDEAVIYLGDNPDEIRRSIARDEIRASPAYKKWLYSEVFMMAGRGDILQKAQQAEALAAQGQLAGLPPGGGPSGAPQPGVFEGGGPGAGGVPDLGALATAPNGTGANPPQYGQVVAGAQQPGGNLPPGGVPFGPPNAAAAAVR